MTDPNLDRRLAALESRLGRLEQLLGTLNDRLEIAPAAGDTKASIQAWVTDYVSMRLQQLVPETCEHPEGEAPAVAEGPVLPGTRVRCTEEVLHRLVLFGGGDLAAQPFAEGVDRPADRRRRARHRGAHRQNRSQHR